jgi:hypothetical protein
VSDSDRQALAAEQRALLAALAGGSVPPGFDVGRVALAGRTLLNKRRRAVERAWPALAAVPAFVDHFAAYAAAVPLPRGGGRADGRRCFLHMRAGGFVTDDARVEQVVDLAMSHWAAAARLGRRRFVVAVRCPWAPRVWTLRI